MDSNVGIVILAAGLGTRMKSDKAKVLHSICGRPMVHYVVRQAVAVAGNNVVVVVGHQAEQVKQTVSDHFDVHFALQQQQLGTGHAVMCALPKISAMVDQVVVLCGDVPLIRAATISKLVADHCTHQRDVTVLAVAVDDPTGYGRIIFNADGNFTGIVEQADADEVQKELNIINTGIYVVRRSFLALALPQIGTDNAQNEIYLTDIVAIGGEQNRTVGTMVGPDSNEVMGVNSRDELQVAEKLMLSINREKS